MKREYVRGSKEHWKEVQKYVYGFKTNSCSGICGDDKAIFVRNKVGGFTFYTDEIVYDAITTNPNWHEVKPWEDKPYEPKPFDKVLGWSDDDPSDIRPDIFLYKRDVDGETRYVCTSCYWDHIKPYNEKEYMEYLYEL